MDKTSKMIFEYINQLPNKKLRYTNPDIDKAANKLDIDPSEFLKCIEYLRNDGTLKESRGGIGIKYIELSHPSLHIKEFKRIQFCNYSKRNLIAILGLIAAIIPIIISFL